MERDRLDAVSHRSSCSPNIQEIRGGGLLSTSQWSVTELPSITSEDTFTHTARGASRSDIDEHAYHVKLPPAANRKLVTIVRSQAEITQKAGVWWIRSFWNSGFSVYSPVCFTSPCSERLLMLASHWLLTLQRMTSDLVGWNLLAFRLWFSHNKKAFVGKFPFLLWHFALFVELLDSFICVFCSFSKSTLHTAFVICVWVVLILECTLPLHLALLCYSLGQQKSLIYSMRCYLTYTWYPEKWVSHRPGWCWDRRPCSPGAARCAWVSGWR